VEGVLIPKRRYLLLQIINWLKLREKLLAFTFGFLYELGVISLESALRRIYKLFKGVSLTAFSQTSSEITFIPGAKRLFEVLRQKRYKTVLLSSGLPTEFVKELAKKLGSDYAYGLELKTYAGNLTGEIGGDSLKKGGKVIVLKRLLNDGLFLSKNCIVVADDRNNLPLLNMCSQSIGYNADFLISLKSTYVVKGDLLNILPYFDANPRKELPSPLSNQELFRKTIHTGCFFIPLLCKYLDINVRFMSFLIIVVCILYLVSEVSRLTNSRFPLFYTITSKAVTGTENWNFALSPLLFAVGIVISLLIFPVPVGYVSITILTIGDGFAAVIGKEFGRIPNPLDKSKRLEGTLLGFLFSFLGTLLFIDPIRGILAASVGLLIESIPLPINDNLSIPILCGLALMLL